MVIHRQEREPESWNEMESWSRRGFVQTGDSGMGSRPHIPPLTCQLCSGTLVLGHLKDDWQLLRSSKTRLGNGWENCSTREIMVIKVKFHSIEKFGIRQLVQKKVSRKSNFIILKSDWESNISVIIISGK